MGRVSAEKLFKVVVKETVTVEIDKESSVFRLIYDRVLKDGTTEQHVSERSLPLMNVYAEVNGHFWYIKEYDDQTGLYTGYRYGEKKNFRIDEVSRLADEICI